MTSASASVRRDLVVNVVAPSTGPRQVQVRLRYDTTDPFAVHARFRVAADQSVSWMFARELLTAGLDEPAGDGDVRIWPAYDDCEVVRITLRSPDGEAMLDAAAVEIVEFLDATYTLCPRGNERHHVDIDRELEALLQ